MTLEDIISTEKIPMKKEKVMVTSDYHIPFIDNKAYSVMREFAKDYKPSHFIINGDFVDFYISLSGGLAKSSKRI